MHLVTAMPTMEATNPRLRLDRATFRTWLTSDLVQVQAESVDSGRKFEHIDRAALSVKELPRFFPLIGVTLDDAIAGARVISHATSRMHDRFDPDSGPLGYAMAVAVLQAGDGAYWGSLLGTGNGRRGMVVYDPAWEHTRITRIDPLRQDVRAVVGAQDVVRFA